MDIRPNLVQGTVKPARYIWARFGRWNSKHASTTAAPSAPAPAPAPLASRIWLPHLGLVSMSSTDTDIPP